MHLNQMCYSDEIQSIIKDQIQILIERVKKKEKPFGLSDIHMFHEQFKNLSKK